MPEKKLAQFANGCKLINMDVCFNQPECSILMCIHMDNCIKISIMFTVCLAIMLPLLA